MLNKVASMHGQKPLCQRDFRGFYRKKTATQFPQQKEFRQPIRVKKKIHKQADHKSNPANFPYARATLMDKGQHYPVQHQSNTSTVNQQTGIHPNNYNSLSQSHSPMKRSGQTRQGSRQGENRGPGGSESAHR